MDQELAVDDLRNSSSRLLELLKLSFISATAFISFATLGGRLPIEGFTSWGLLRTPLIVIGIGLWFLSIIFIPVSIGAINPNKSTWSQVAEEEKDRFLTRIRLGISPRQSNWARRISLFLVAGATSSFFLGSANYILSLIIEPWNLQLTFGVAFLFLTLFAGALMTPAMYFPVLYGTFSHFGGIISRAFVKVATYPPESAYRRLEWMDKIDYEILKELDDQNGSARIDELSSNLDEPFERLRDRCKMLTEKGLLKFDRGYHVELDSVGVRYINRDYPFRQSPINFIKFYKDFARRMIYLGVIAVFILAFVIISYIILSPVLNHNSGI